MLVFISAMVESRPGEERERERERERTRNMCLTFVLGLHVFICSFRCIAHFKDFERRCGSALSQQGKLLVKVHAFRALALRARTAHIVTRRVEIWIIEAYHEPTVKDQIQAQTESQIMGLRVLDRVVLHTKAHLDSFQR